MKYSLLLVDFFVWMFYLSKGFIFCRKQGSTYAWGLRYLFYKRRTHLNRRHQEATLLRKERHGSCGPSKGRMGSSAGLLRFLPFWPFTTRHSWSLQKLSWISRSLLVTWRESCDGTRKDAAKGITRMARKRSVTASSWMSLITRVGSQANKHASRESERNDKT